MRAGWLGAVILSIGVSAHAQEYLSPPPQNPSPITDHMAFRAIYYFGKVSTEARFDPSQTVPGTSFSAERDLGLTDRADQFNAEAMFRFEERNRLRVSFLDLRRGGDTTLDQDIQYGNQLFLKGEEVKSELDYRQFDLTYTYSFLRSKWYELGAGLGVLLLEAETSADVPNTPKIATFSGVVAVPFVAPAIDGTILLDRHWSFNARGEWFRVSINATNGLLDDFHTDLQYRWRSALAFGAGFQWHHVSLHLAKTNPPGDVRLSVNGPEVFLRASF
jgi:hypothetical protein